MTDNDSEETIFIVDDNDEFRNMLVELLKLKQYRTVAFRSAVDFCESTETNGPGCLILDICLPEMSGLELQQDLLQRNQNIPIVFLTGKGDIPQTVQALKAGAVDFLQKPVDPEQLFISVEQALATSRKILDEQSDVDKIRNAFARLSVREAEVLNLLVAESGNISSKQIANHLGVSHRTIDHHRTRIMDKTGASSLTDLILMAQKSGNYS